ncbi:hypothetical protein ASPFODRAFT_147839 [Aspergillus luchuensis CBS 106.47]|uniref:HMG box domain-containing protein n=1 Tax=Aspergillus luchuensis (strain CBS 106.47) TaxID=1137211 RepID=A0A1M3T0X4_ASPLC|nr:hypothetical protein ASPFODRAFT_147839 [Aspergillus luchuensis CBS 106.47]
MSESSVATTKPTEIGTEASTSLQATPGDPMSEPPPPYFQAWFMPGTGCEELSQRLPCISDGLPQASGKLAVSFGQPVPVLEFAANDPYYLVPQPIHDNTQTHEDKLIPEEGSDADHTKPEALCRKTGLRKSSCFEAQTRDGQAKYAATRSQNPCLPCPLSELNDGMQDIPVRDMYAWVHRPVATRRQETRQRHQRIPRPLNSFILYRMAYNDRVKHLLGQNDHQTISRLSGQSWKMEAAHIREKYKTLAEMEKQNHARAHPGYRFTLLNKQGKPRTAKGRSRLRSEAFSNFGQDSQPAAWATSADNNRACERSTGTFTGAEGTLIQSCSLISSGCIPLGSAASVWAEWTSYPQTTSAEHGSKGTQPRLPVVTGQTEIAATACLVSQPAAPGIDAANCRSASLPLSIPYEIGNTAYNARATAKAHPSQTSSFVVIGTFAGIPIPVTEAMLECVNGSSCDESDFLTLFSEPTPLVNPTPSVSWIEAELAEMEAKDRHDPQHYESTSGDSSVHDRQMTGSSLDDVSYLSQDTRTCHSDRVS